MTTPSNYRRSSLIIRNIDIPKEVWDGAKVGEGDGVHYSMNVMGSMLLLVVHKLKFQGLSKIAKLVLIITRSNASKERGFSLIRKNKTTFRPSLGLDGTLSSLITTKMAIEEPCIKVEPSKALLETAKKATLEYNKAHSSTQHTASSFYPW